MDQRPNVENCRWARLTLRLPYPLWLEFEDKPWSCLRNAEPRPLDDTAVCHDCPRWEPRHLAVVQA